MTSYTPPVDELDDELTDTEFEDEDADFEPEEPEKTFDELVAEAQERIVQPDGTIQTTYSQNLNFKVGGKTTQFGGEGEMSAEHRAEIQAVVQELERQSTNRIDFMTHTSLIKAIVEPRILWDELTLNIETHYDLVLQFEFEGPFYLKMKVNKLAHDQVASTLGVGQYFYSKLLETPADTGDRKEALDLLAQAVNHFLERAGKRVLIRTMDDQVRAILSPDYLIRDNYDLLFALLEPLKEVGAEVRQLFVSEKRFYVRALHPEWRDRVKRQHMDVIERGQIFQDWMADLKADDNGNIPYFSRLNPNNVEDPWSGLGTDGGFGQGPIEKDRVLRNDWDDDWIIPGIHGSNSETGHGNTTLANFALRTICMNGTVMDAPITARHMLRGANPLDGFLSPETHQKINEAVWAEIQDMVRATFDPEKFRAMVEQMSEAATRVIRRPTLAVDQVIQKYSIPPKKRQELLNYLIVGNDPTQWGLINAVTAMARESKDIDERMELEVVGGKMVEAVR